MSTIDRVRGHRRRIFSAVALFALLALTSCIPKPWPTRSAYLNAADRAGAWLAAHYTANHASMTPSQDADLILALAALDLHRDTAKAALGDLEAGITAAWSQPGSAIPVGGLAKAILAVDAMGHDPKNFGGIDLAARLESLEVMNGADQGRYGTASTYEQAFAVIATLRFGAVSTDAVNWLAGRACPNGAFSWGSCASPDPDLTAVATMALHASGKKTSVVDAAVSWLTSIQNADGGFGDGTSNANTTGLVASVLRGTGHDTAADAAGDWISSIQYAMSAGSKAGAIPWQPGTDGSLFMATTQGVFAFGSGGLDTVRFPQVIGEACGDTDGVTVVVDTARFDNTITIGCAPGAQTSGLAALSAAGFSVGQVPGVGGAVCTIDNQPSTGYPDCWMNGFWSYWHDSSRSGSWASSSVGAGGYVPPAGSVEGWRFEPSPSTHAALPPGISPTASGRCVTPTAQTLNPISNQETLTFTGGWGASVQAWVGNETGFMATSVPGPTSTLNLAGIRGPVTVAARSVDPACDKPSWFLMSIDVADTYPPNAKTSGTNAVALADPAFLGWASGVADYQPGPNVTQNWQVPEKALGQPEASAPGVVPLGDNGSITLTFEDPITNGPGADFAVFENAFQVNANTGLDFLELGYVELSSDGIHFARFGSASRRTTPVGAFTGQRADEIGGLVGRDLAGYGTPFDLAQLTMNPAVRHGLVDLNAITHVRVVDILGDGSNLDSFGRPIYDTTPTSGSGGLDLAGIGVINQAD